MAKSADRTPVAAPIIPARQVIGVTGHRELADQPVLGERVQDVLQLLRATIARSATTPLVLTVLSPLAEGADRLVAREVLRIPGSQLEAILPLAKDSYLQDFTTGRSRAEFEELLGRARAIIMLPATAGRGEAYAQAGRYVVDHCDVLIALWSGEAAGGPGGTAEVVAYARRRRRPLFWIHVDAGGEVTSEQDFQPALASFAELDRYNAERLDAAAYARRVAGTRVSLRAAAESAGLPAERLHGAMEQVLPHLVRSDLLTLRYQHRYLRAGTWLYAAAAAAVGVVAFQAIFLPEQPAVALVEVALMLGILAILWLGRWQRWHGKWIDYRFLAERFRSALFMAIAGVEVGVLRPPRHLSLAYSTRDWMVAAFHSVWSRVPLARETSGPDLDALRGFLLHAWLNDQIRYHRQTSQRHHRRQRRLEIAGTALFALTFAAAALHVAEAGPAWMQRLLGFTAIVLPAIGSALAAIRMHREYLRSARRSAEMASHLEELKERVQEARDLEALLALVREAEEIMLHEHEDWRAAVRFRRSELPA